MRCFTIEFAGHRVDICCDSSHSAAFLAFLFGPMLSRAKAPGHSILEITCGRNRDGYVLASGSGVLYKGQLGVAAAAVLYDAVIFQLLDKNTGGIALHAGAVSSGHHAMLVPGVSGAGKSSVVAWLTANGFTYGTDELVFLHNADLERMETFHRPISLKRGSVAAVLEVIGRGNDELMADEQGALVPPAMLNPGRCCSKPIPRLILFSRFRETAVTGLTEVSRASAVTRLMTSCANGRNLPEHGFREMAKLARRLPSYQLTFSSFVGFSNVLGELKELLAR